MKKANKKLFSLLMCVILIAATASAAFTPVSAASSASQLQNDIANLKKESQRIQNEINSLKSQKADQNSILAAIQKKIANTQAQIVRCNQEISSINSKIDSNKSEINAKNKEIDANKLAFKKRIRAIYMSNSDSPAQILLGAENFSDYLQLAQLTSAVSSHDKAIIEKIADAVKILNAKLAENQKLLEQQVTVKNSVVESQNALKSEEAEAKNLFNQISAQQKDKESDKADVQAAIKAKQNALNEILSGGNSYNSFINPNTGFMWPVPGYFNITSYYGPRWGTTHYGIDISSGGIYGKPIVAVADGYVYRTYNSCTHTDKASRCSCGSGWGNHVGINHGTIGGANYKAMYAHMDRIAVSNGQYVKQGQVIGYVGTTGDSTGYHLHFGLMKNGAWVNPYPYFYK